MPQPQTKKIHELPRNTKLRVRATIVPNLEQEYEATFHHLDGMYSYCTLDNHPNLPPHEATFHLHYSQEMVEVNGRWELTKS